MKEFFSVFFKGAAMGAANVIPGVSGGTVAFITGIYERLINAIKSLDVGAVKLLTKGKFREFAGKVDFWFLFSLGVGVIVSILSLAEILKFLFKNHAVYVWAFFFGLILASIFFVGKQVKRWSTGAVIALLIGAGIAIGTALLKPASENSSVWYLFLCGVVAMASMIIPGLSGSFVLLLLGNYQLVMIDSVSGLKTGDMDAIKTLIPVGVGAVAGMLALSRILAWIFREFHDQAVALLTGFVAGSLLVIWPWKEGIIKTFVAGEEIKEKTIGYRWFIPELSPEVAIAVGIMIVGMILVWLMERSGAVGREDKSSED